MLPPKLRVKVGKPLVGGDSSMTRLDLFVVSLILCVLAAVILPAFFR